MTKVHKINLSAIDDKNPLAAAIDQKYKDDASLAGFPLVSTFVTSGDDGSGNTTDYLVLIFQKLS